MQRRIGRSHAARTDAGQGVGSWVAVILLVALAGCAARANTRSAPPSERPTVTASPTITASPRRAGPTCGEPARTAINLVVRDVHFNVRCLVVPKGRRLTVRFENRDLFVTHNFSIRTAGFEKVFTGDVAYPQEKFDYRVPALGAGEYLFRCDIHPQDMSGVLLVQ